MVRATVPLCRWSRSAGAEDSPLSGEVELPPSHPVMVPLPSTVTPGSSHFFVMANLGQSFQGLGLPSLSFTETTDEPRDEVWRRSQWP